MIKICIVPHINHYYGENHSQHFLKNNVSCLMMACYTIFLLNLFFLLKGLWGLWPTSFQLPSPTTKFQLVLITVLLSAFMRPILKILHLHEIRQYLLLMPDLTHLMSHLLGALLLQRTKFLTVTAEQCPTVCIYLYYVYFIH